MRKVAIVGSSESHWSERRKILAIKRITDILQSETPKKINPTGFDGEYRDRADIVLISGHSPKRGVDIWAETIAVTLGIETDIKRADVKQWNSIETENILFKGYMQRNIEIAQSCDVLYCIDPKGRQGGGGQWTLNYAKELGKEVYHEVIE